MKSQNIKLIRNLSLTNVILILLVVVGAFAGGLLLYHNDRFSLKTYAGDLNWQNIGRTYDAPSSIEFAACRVVDDSSAWTIRGLATLFPALPYFNTVAIPKYTWKMSEYSVGSNPILLNQTRTDSWYAGEASLQQLVISPKTYNTIQFSLQNEGIKVSINPDQIQLCNVSSPS